ncbi:MAG TPA: glutathione S-transferase family protein [Rhodanobacteraceae bacterium]
MSDITFFHSPRSRSAVTRALLEELGVPFDLVPINLEAGEQRSPEFLAINPMGKVPAIRHAGTLITEQPAIILFLADLYADKGLAPALNDPLRADYLRWMVFYGSCMEPAMMDHSLPNRATLPRQQCGYGTYEEVIAVVADQLSAGPWLLGERFTAADVLWGMAMQYGFQFRLIPELPALRAYADRVLARPAITRAREQDALLAAQQSIDVLAAVV